MELQPKENLLNNRKGKKRGRVNGGVYHDDQYNLAENKGEVSNIFL